MHGSSQLPIVAPRLLPAGRPAVIGTRCLSIDDVPERERPLRLQEFFEPLGVRYDADHMGCDPIEIDLVLRGLPGILVLSGRMQGARYRRTRVNPDPTEDVGLLLNARGAHLVGQIGREVVLGDGDATLISLTEPLETTHRPPGELLVLRVPRPLLAPRLAAGQDRFLRLIPRGSPALGLLTSYIEVAWHEHTLAAPDLHGPVVSHLHDLMAVAIGATRDAEHIAQGGGLRAARLHSIKQDIARHLDRPDLSVAVLAQRHGCTPRLVQRLFEHEGSTFTDYVLAQRLARAYRLLADPRRRAEKISTVAADCGFGDASYFNRVFRRRYGAAPSDVRTPARRNSGVLGIRYDN
jgi:AraC-like DNA-binding protein